MRLGDHLRDGLLAQRGHLIGWVPVCLGLGIGGYFLLRFEPSMQQNFVVGALALLCLIIRRFVPVAIAPLCLGLALILAGGIVAKVRTEMVAAPVLTFRYYGPIEGRVVAMDRSASDALRITLDRVRLDRFAPDRVPHRVRISLHGSLPDVPLLPGQRVMTTGHLSPPSGPAEPGGYDFQRHAWFAGIGAVGYTRNPLLRAAPPEPGGWRVAIFQARMAISQGVQQTLPGEPGAFAAAIMSGDRSGIGQDTLTDLRSSNLAHLLAISGLHMGLLTAFVFASLRTLLVLMPAIGLRVPTKKIAAVGALMASASYLALSGGNVATERAFIMVSVMLVGVLLGRPALTLRAVAIAATIVLVLQPEALTGPGFQMSFAATTALVAVFQALRKVPLYHLPRWARAALAVFTSSLVAGLATAPIAAAHFNQIAHYGLIANLLSVPLMGAIIMPAAVLAACLAPFGLEWVGLSIVGVGLQWILGVAATVSDIAGAVGPVVSPTGAVLPLIALGGLLVILWQGRARALGVPVALVGFLLWSMTTRPPILIAESGNLIGVMTPEGRALSRAKGDGFVARVWLENDGQGGNQVLAADRAGLAQEARVARTRLGEWDVLQVSGKTAPAALTGCDGADVLVSNQTIEADLPCRVFDVQALRQTGALAFRLSEDKALHIQSARAKIGSRPWNSVDPAIASLTLALRPREEVDGRITVQAAHE